MKKTFTFILALFSTLCVCLLFANVGANAPSAPLVFLQQQESSDGTSIRYVSTLVDLDYEDILGIDVFFELTKDSKTYEAKADVTTVYSSVTNAAQEICNACYAVYTLEFKDDKGNITSDYLGAIIKAKFVYYTNTTNYETNEVSHRIGTKVDVLYNETSSAGHSSAGNGQYITKTFREIYLADETTIDTDGLNIKIDDNLVDKSNFVIDYSYFKTRNLGVCPVIITVGNETVVVKTYKAYALSGASSGSIYTVSVDSTYDMYPGLYSNGIFFHTINQALDFFRINRSGIGYKSIEINVYAGVYEEKLELDIPNLTLKAVSGNAVTIQYGALYGYDDGTGFSHVTDSTATVAVRANNVTIEDLTIRNKYDSIDAYAGTNYEGTGERGLALLVQGDQFVSRNVCYKGWQDTVELFTGRQYFTGGSICGCIDYIFGTNNTTIFDNVNIITVTGKTGSTADKVNAYVTAFKGDNNNDSTTVKYGAIFNNCHFTTDENYVGKVAFARPWSSNSNVIFMNIEYTNKYSTVMEETIATGLINESLVDTTKLNIKFYNITLTHASENAYTNVDTKLTTEEYNAIYDGTNVIISEVFAKTNANVSFDYPWNPANPINEYTYSFVGHNSASEYVNNDFITFESDSIGQVKSDCTQIKNGKKITIHVPASSTIKVSGYHSIDYNKYTLGGVEPAKTTLIQYYDTASDVDLVAFGNCYLYSITIYYGYRFEAEIESLTVTNTPNEDLLVGTDLDLSGLVVKVINTDGTSETLDKTQYTVNDSSVDKTTAGTYTVTVSYSGVSTTFNVKYVAEIDNTISSTLRMDFKKGSYNYVGETENWNNSSTFKVTGNVTHNGVEFTGCNSNGDNGWLAYSNKATIKFSVSGACKVRLYFYQGANNTTVTLNGETVACPTTPTNSQDTPYEYTISSAGEVVITANSSGYFGLIEIIFE